MPKASKGSAFERWFCTRLSLWWTQNLPTPRDDVFWRTHNSGGRATTRSKKGRGTHGQYGDICAVDPVGEPLLKLLCFELKRGYAKDTIADLLDRPAGAKPQKYEDWILKAELTRQQAGAYSWALVTRRDRRVPLIFAPSHLRTDLRPFVGAGCPEAVLSLEIQGVLRNVNCVTLDSWLENVRPARVLEFLQRRGLE